MKKRNAAVILPLLCIVFCLPLTACALGSLKYSAEPIEARVVDAETKQPIEGAIVVAHWALEGGMHWDRVGTLQVMEAVTDQNGQFSFPAWGPIETSKGILTDRDPELLLFKNGYEYRELWNFNASGDLERLRSSMRRSDWNGKTIELRPFKGTAEEYARHLAFLKTSLGFAYNGENCEWRNVPHMLVAQHIEKRRLDEKDIFNTLQSIDRVAGQKKCGSAQKFFQDYLP